MRNRTLKNILQILMLLCVAVFVTGCTSLMGGRQSSKVATLQRVGDDYYQAEQQTEATDDALTELSLAADRDLDRAYDEFAQSADWLLETGKNLVAHADAMYFEGPSYFVESVKSASACVLPRRDAQKDQGAEELGPYFDAIAEDGWEVKQAFRAYQFDMIQLMDYLSVNLTPYAIDLITPIIRKSQVDSDSLKGALERALAAVEQAKDAKSQVQVPPQVQVPTPGQ